MTLFQEQTECKSLISGAGSNSSPVIFLKIFVFLYWVCYSDGLKRPCSLSSLTRKSRTCLRWGSATSPELSTASPSPGREPFPACTFHGHLFRLLYQVLSWAWASEDEHSWVPALKELGEEAERWPRNTQLQSASYSVFGQRDPHGSPVTAQGSEVWAWVAGLWEHRGKKDSPCLVSEVRGMETTHNTHTGLVCLASNSAFLCHFPGM